MPLKLKQFLEVLCFLGFVGTGFVVMQQSWDGVVYIYAGSDERLPAAIKKTYDFSHLKGMALQNASRERLLSAARITRHSKGQVSIELGHFLTRDEATHRQVLACDLYDRVEVVLSAVGVANAGATPSMTVEAPCHVSTKDINMIEPIWIDSKEILKQVPGDHEFMFHAKYTSSIKFADVVDAWPEEWEITSVKLFSTAPTAKNVIAVTSKTLPKAALDSSQKVLTLK